jgi:phosphoribosylanthranilate isomerase
MSLKTIVKVGNISNLSDARYCAGMGVDYLGFCMDHYDTNYIDAENFKNIKNWVVGPKIIGEFSTNKSDYIRDSLRNYSMDMLEVSYPEVISEITDIQIPKILRIDVSSYPTMDSVEERLETFSDQAAFFILEKSDDSQDSLSTVLSLASRYKILLGFGIDEKTVSQLILSSNIYGISMHGGSEIQPGFKDYDDLADILEILERDD